MPTRALGSILLSLLVFCSTPSIAQQQCYNLNKSNLEEGWDIALSNKRAALENALEGLAIIRKQVEADAAGLGNPGSAKEATIAIALVVRETTDLIGLVASAFRPAGSQIQKVAIKVLKQARKEIDKEFHEADSAINGETKEIIDRLPAFVPGAKLIQDMKDWEGAKSELSQALRRIDIEISGLNDKLHALGGPDRAYSVDALLKRSEARWQQCVEKINDNTAGEQASCEKSCDQWFSISALPKANADCRLSCRPKALRTP